VEIAADPRKHLLGSYDSRITAQSLKTIYPNIDDADKRIFKFYSDVNTGGFRSDEFRVHSSTDKKHVLFAGCSQTYGIGVPRKFTWGQLVYNKLKNKIPTTGFFNIGTPGITYLGIAVEIINYISRYGTPDILFVNLPDPFREYASLKKRPNNKYDFARRKEPLLEIGDDWSTHLVKHTRSLFESIQRMVKEAYIFSWDMDFNNKKEFLNLKSILNAYNIFDEMDVNLEIMKVSKKYKDDDPRKLYDIRGLDKSHAGAAQHEVWADYIYNKFIENTSLIK
jgi:hypothetical protein